MKKSLVALLGGALPALGALGGARAAPPGMVDVIVV